MLVEKGMCSDGPAQFLNQSNRSSSKIRNIPNMYFASGASFPEVCPDTEKHFIYVLFLAYSTTLHQGYTTAVG
jgi:hypothetical protein